MNELDAHVFLLLHRALDGGWTAPMAVLSAIGGGWGSLVVLPLVASPRTKRAGSSLAIVLLVTALTVFFLKRVVARARPCACLPGVHARVFAAPTDFSFPSGHAAGSFAFAVFLAVLLVRTTPREASRRERLVRSLGAVVLTTAALGVGLSRIALGVHFPGDVIAGAMVGGAIAAVGAYVHLGRRGLEP